MKMQKRILETQKKFEGNVGKSFMFIAENKSGVNVPLYAEYESDEEIRVYSIKMSGSNKKYNQLDTITTKVFENNSIIKSVHGTSKIAQNLRKVVGANLTNEEVVRIAKERDNIFTEEQSSLAVNAILTQKIRESAESKYQKLLDISNKSIEKSFMVVFDNNGQHVYLHAELNDSGMARLTSPLKRTKLDFSLSTEELVCSDKVLSIKGTNELAEKLKEMHGKKKIHLEENNDITIHEPEIVESIKSSQDENSIQDILKKKEKKTLSRKIKKK